MDCLPIKITILFICSALFGQRFGDTQFVSNNDDYIINVAQVEIADMDNDGLNDIVTASGSSIVWYKNLDNGNWSINNFIANTLGGINELHLVEVNNDNAIDIICPKKWGNAIDYYINQQDGTFTEDTITTQLDGHSIIVTEDFNQDGYLDVVSLSSNDKIAIYYNEEGQFGQQFIIDNDIFSGNGIEKADFDNDGLQDIIAIGANNNSVYYYRNEGNEVFAEKQEIIDTAYGSVEDLISFDFNNDSFIDILYVSLSNEFVFYENKGDTYLEPAKTIGDFASIPIKISALDFDNNGSLEFIYATNTNIYAIEYINDDTFETTHLFNLSRIGETYSTGDIVGGEIAEFVTVENFEVINVYEQFSVDQYNESNVIQPDVIEPIGTIMRDIDLDGDADVFTLSLIDGDISFYKNLQGEDLEDKFAEYQNITLTVNAVTAFDISDVNHDGLEDIVVSGIDSPYLFWFENNGQAFDGTNFVNQHTIDINSAVATEVTIIDFNLDGWNDILTKDELGIIRAFYGSENAIFFNSEILNESHTNISEYHVVDFDADADLDIIAVQQTEETINDWLFINAVLLIENDGLMNFDTVTELAQLPSSNMNLLPFDYDSDDDMDVIVSNVREDYFNAGAIYTITNTDNQFILDTLLVSYSPTNIYAQDIDGDNQEEILFGNASELTVLSKNNDAYNVTEMYPGMNADVVFKDFDLDGDPDILLTKIYSNIIELRENMPMEPIVEFLIDPCFMTNESFQIENNALFYIGNSEVYWDFGDENISSKVHPFHSYAAPGTYHIQQVICNNHGCDTLTRTTEVLEFEIAPPESVVLNEPINFSNTNNGITNFTWFFGPAPFTGEQSFEAEPSHTFTQAGSHIVSVILTNNEIEDCTFTQQFQVEVQAGTNIESLSNHEQIFIDANNIILPEFCVEDCTIALLNVQGKVILKANSEAFTGNIINALQLQTGIYFLQIGNKLKMKVYKVFIGD